MAMPSDSYYLDTSVVVAAVVDSVAHHRSALDFCQQRFDERASIYYSELLRLEYAQAFRALPSRLGPDIQREHGLHRWHQQEVRERWFRHGW